MLAHVVAEERAAKDVQVAVLLALHRVVAEVRKQAEAAGAELPADLGRNAPDMADVVLP